MMRKISLWFVLASFFGMIAASEVNAGSPVLVKFDGGIGVIPNAAASGALNMVRGVSPAGQIWVISDLRAVVGMDGTIRVDGRGLLLGGGNNIGFNAGASVFATLICEALEPFVHRSTNMAGVPLEPNGDFRIEDMLTPAPVDCASPVLLIRSSGSGSWFAAGIPKM